MAALGLLLQVEAVAHPIHFARVPTLRFIAQIAIFHHRAGAQVPSFTNTFRRMYSLILLLIGTFWEVGMDVVANSHNYERSLWARVAAWAESQGMPRLGHGFWDHSIAWRNKWREGDPQRGPRFPGSTTLFVTVVDGWHLLKFLWLMHVCFAIVLYTPLTPWLPLDALICYAAFGVGHECWWRLTVRRASGLHPL